MIGDKITCEHIGCNIVFTKRTHNQRYHDDECCRLATNQKIMQKYYQRRAQKLGHVRYCDVCTAKLSKYNSDSTCNSCLRQSETNRNNTVANMLSKIEFVV